MDKSFFILFCIRDIIADPGSVAAIAPYVHIVVEPLAQTWHFQAKDKSSKT